MKNKITQILVLGLLVIGSMNFAFAGAGGYEFRGTIPFDFQVGEKKFKSGEYVISKRMTSHPDLYFVESADGKDSAMILITESGSGIIQNKSVIKFNKYGEVYFLSGIEASDLNLRFQTSKSERKLMKAYDGVVVTVSN